MLSRSVVCSGGFNRKITGMVLRLREGTVGNVDDFADMMLRLDAHC